MRPETSREDWLRACLTRCTAGWPNGADLPENTRISVGFPAKAGRNGTPSVVSYGPRFSEDGYWEIFVSPTLSDPTEVTRAVITEAAKISTGRLPSAAEQAVLFRRADAVTASLPKYPHSAIKVDGPASRPPGTPGPGSRLIKISCPQCGYIVRITRKWIERGRPMCPCCDELMGPAP